MFGSKMMRAAVATTIGLLAMGTLALTSVTSSAGANQAPMVHSSFSMTLTSQGKQLRTTGPGLNSTYGWNQLTGPTTIDGQASSAEWLATVNYVNGSGACQGFLTLTTPTGVLSMRVDGQARYSSTAGITTFTGQLPIIGGTGSYANSSGWATFTGNRTTALGGAVNITVSMWLHGTGS